MEKQPVIVEICNQQWIDGAPEKIEMTVTGFIYAEETQLTIEYTEYDEENQKTETTVHCQNHKFVSVTRRGAMESQMLFQQGRRNTSVYSTPYGDMQIGMYTKKVQCDIPLEGMLCGKLRFAYTTDFAGTNTIENAMTLTIRQRKV